VAEARNIVCAAFALVSCQKYELCIPTTKCDDLLDVSDILGGGSALEVSEGLGANSFILGAVNFDEVLEIRHRVIVQRLACDWRTGIKRLSALIPLYQRAFIFVRFLNARAGTKACTTVHSGIHILLHHHVYLCFR
jgi:hypothetical protein